MNPLYYRPIYLAIVTILTLITCYQYNDWHLGNRRNPHLSRPIFAGLLAVFMILFIGFRPPSLVFVDMWAYYNGYINFHLGESFAFTWDTENYLFDNLMSWFGANYIDSKYFFLLMSVLYFGPMYWACRKIYPNDTLLSFLVCLGAFSTFSYATNGIKAGVAASIFLLALAYRKNLLVAIPLLWVSLGFHHAMLAPIVAFAITSLFRKPQVYLILWLFCLLLAAFHVTYFMDYFSGFVDEHGAGYLIDDVENVVLQVSGFRFDFILYSAVPIFLGFYFIVAKKIVSDRYNFLWCAYTLTNCVFLLCTYGKFINRIAYLSWLMLPIVLIYPLLYGRWNEDRPSHLKYVVYGHLAFTLFMSFIY